MKFGLKLHHSGPGASPDYMRRWAQFAEVMGFHSVMTADHVALTPDVLKQYPAPYFEAFTNLAWLAAHTQKVRLGTTVIVLPYRHPIYLAQLTSNVDQLSGGRLIFGIGAGWAQSEFEALGVPFQKRGAITDDYLAAIKTLWTHNMASYEGPFISFHDVTISPRPVQSPYPPVWVGGNSEAGMRRAACFGDAWHPIGVRITWLKEIALPQLQRIAEKEKRPVPALCPRIWCRLTESPLPEETRVAGEGTLDQVRHDLEALQEMGAEEVLLDTKRNSPTASSSRHHEEAWRALTILVEKAIDLENETVR
ncbi:MAG: TIGR03619 family F420-dependent LLM class oxidoreductase [Candidatus Tectomicrobia bacterium]|nr:TIGR03619 family F420-dependent LLM class oxidoreductase [Candidatus Tectomicrobia bacterium]